MISPNIIIPFDGDHADIPSGFERDTRFDNRFPKGASSGFGDTGGDSTHSHTSSAHSHTMNNHTHTMTIGGQDGGAGEDDGGGSTGTDVHHTHWGSTPRTSTAMSGGTLSDTVNYPSSNHLPEYYTMIFIKSSKYNFIPINGIVMSESATRQDFDFHTDSAGKNIVGADTGENAGDTGGNSTHSHVLTHTHSAVNHSHTGETPVDTSDITVNAASSNDHATSNHKHTLYWQNQSLAGGQQTLVASATANNTPLSAQINLFKATKKSLPIPGDIVMTTESVTPVGWLDCDGSNDTPNLNGYYIKNKASASADVSYTGSNTHSHAASNSHTHGSSNHTHTGLVSQKYSDGETGVGGNRASQTHRHSVTNVSSTNATWANANVAASDSENNEPPYIKVKFIQYEFGVGGGALFAIA